MNIALKSARGKLVLGLETNETRLLEEGGEEVLLRNGT
jgi:hypothetical protein